MTPAPGDFKGFN